MTKRTMSDGYMLRFPDGMRDAIKAMARENERSINAEIIFHLRRAIPTETGNEEDRQGGHPDGL